MAACAALEAARNATTAAERNAAGAAFGSLLTKVEAPAKPRRSRRIAAAAEANAAKAAAAAAAAHEIDAYLVEEEAALQAKTAATTAKEKLRRKLEAQLSLLESKQSDNDKRYLYLRVAVEENALTFINTASQPIIGEHNMCVVKNCMNALRTTAVRAESIHHKIKALEARIAAL